MFRDLQDLHTQDSNLLHFVLVFSSSFSGLCFQTLCPSIPTKIPTFAPFSSGFEPCTAPKPANFAILRKTIFHDRARGATGRLSTQTVRSMSSQKKRHQENVQANIQNKKIAKKYYIIAKWQPGFGTETVPKPTTPLFPPSAQTSRQTSRQTWMVRWLDRPSA